MPRHKKRGNGIGMDFKPKGLKCSRRSCRRKVFELVVHPRDENKTPEEQRHVCLRCARKIKRGMEKEEANDRKI